MKKKTKIILIVIGIFVAVIGIFAAIREYKQSQPMLTLKKQNFIVEYGDVVTRNITEYVDINEYKQKKKGPPLLEAKLELNIEDDELYPSVGTYHGIITYRDEKLEFDITVKDTRSPEIITYKKDESIETYQGIIQEYKEMYDVKDLSPATIEIDDSRIDYESAGEYSLILTATDSYNNKSEKKVKVNVKKKELDLRLHSLTVLVTGSTQFAPEIKGKPEKLSYSSSDSETVSVDEQGVIRAKKPGEAIITAKMGEITDTCKVVVKNNPYYKQGK